MQLITINRCPALLVLSFTQFCLDLCLKQVKIASLIQDTLHKIF